VSAHQAVHRVATTCRGAGVSPSGYYPWRKRPLSARAKADLELGAQSELVHRDSRGTYGAPRVQAKLVAQGIRISRKRVARLMRTAGVRGVSRRKQFHTTVRDATARPAPDLVERLFAADGPDRVWVADITYIPTWAGFLYLAVVLDVWSRRVVGWAMALICAQSSCSMPWTWRCVAAVRPTSFILRTRAASVHRSPSGSAVSRPACDRPCAPWATPTTTPCARVLSRRSSVSSWIASASRPRQQRVSPSSTTSKAGTTRVDVILRSATCRPWFVRGRAGQTIAPWRQDRGSHPEALSWYSPRCWCSEEHGP
jgi:HTH-like domain